MNASSYLSTAYSSSSLSRMSAAISRPGLSRLSGKRLPWGNTQELVPEIFMRPEPDSLRLIEEECRLRDEQETLGIYKPKPMEDIDFHYRCDHEHYRHARWAKRSQFSPLSMTAVPDVNRATRSIWTMRLSRQHGKICAPGWTESTLSADQT